MKSPPCLLRSGPGEGPTSGQIPVLVLRAEVQGRGRVVRGRGSPSTGATSAASRLGFQPEEVRREPPGAAHPLPSHCCLGPEPASADIPPAEGGEETPRRPQSAR